MKYEFKIPDYLPLDPQVGEAELRDWLNLRQARRMLSVIPLTGDDIHHGFPYRGPVCSRGKHKIDFGTQLYTITCASGHVLEFVGQLTLTNWRPAKKMGDQESEPVAVEIAAKSDGERCTLMVPDPAKRPAKPFVRGQVVVITKSDSGMTGQLRIISDVCPPESILYLRASTNSRPEMFLASDVKHYEPNL